MMNVFPFKIHLAELLKFRKTLNLAGVNKSITE